ncbi:MAG: pyruvate, phosphate dikinase [Bacillota bacterium]|nr:pyruvate, phosphate dikinase [Bacillota bacterium]
MSNRTCDRYVYMFEEGHGSWRDLLGGKGAGLAEMTRIGLPVPPGFTITTRACADYYRLGKRLPPGLREEIRAAMVRLEERTGRALGDPGRPLLVSVRSGAPVSMPGMMDTILNLGLNPETVAGLASQTDAGFAYDCYRRFIQMFANVVLKMEHRRFEELLEAKKRAVRVDQDQLVPAAAWQELVEEYLALVERETGRPFPQDPWEQLERAVGAVFESWDNPRARVYRRVNRIPDDLGTAVNVQTMVFGNLGDHSATGVMFTRNPSTGEKRVYGEYLVQAQGEDVVAGLRTPQPLERMEEEMPATYRQILDVARLLEEHYRDVQDIEFTVQEGKLYVLQTRSGKRTARAAIRTAVDMVREGLITREEAIGRVDPAQVVQMLHRGVDPDFRTPPLATGLPASPGAATGKVVFDADRAEVLGAQGEAVILVRPETTPDDMHGIVQSRGILTSRGGMTCHAAIVARHMGKPCVVGCEALRIDPEAREFWVGPTRVSEGDVISIDGATGRVFAGEVPLVDPELSAEFLELLKWADEVRVLGVRANADTPEDARRARGFGAAGIGLCRTEHMFMAADRLPVVQEMIMAETEEERRAALDRLLPMQEGDFYEILRAMEGLPVTIRLLDPPLHEFLPRVEELAERVRDLRARLAANPGHWPSSGEGAVLTGEPPAGDPGVAEELARTEKLLRRARALQEANPMLGLRGCRLGILYPEVYEMQARAIFAATARLVREGVDARPEVMIPLVGIARELEIMRELVERVGRQVMEESGITFPLVVGTMIEVPRACLTAGEIARHADFFSFGTNDLTQTTFGFSRDDAEAKFLPHYVEKKLVPENPFMTLDEHGVGRLMAMAVQEGRAVRPDLKVGICGEHGGDPASIDLCHRLGLNYVSCSPFRVPVARLAAARAAIRNRERTGGDGPGNA